MIIEQGTDPDKVGRAANSIIRPVFDAQGWNVVPGYSTTLLKALVAKLDADPMLMETGHHHLIVRRREPTLYEVLISLRKLTNADVRPQGDLPGHNKRSSTSRETSKRVKARKMSQKQQRVLALLRYAGARGMTDDELAKENPAWQISTGSKRRNELSKEPFFLVRQTSERRETRHKGTAFVHVAAEHYDAWKAQYEKDKE